MDSYPEVVFTSPTAFGSFTEAQVVLCPTNTLTCPTPNKIIQAVLVADFNRDGYLDLLAVGTVYDTKPETLSNPRPSCMARKKVSHLRDLRLWKIMEVRHIWLTSTGMVMWTFYSTIAGLCVDLLGGRARNIPKTTLGKCYAPDSRRVEE